MNELFGSKKPASGKYGLVYHKKPSTLTPNEGAAVLMVAAKISDISSVGVDPTKVHIVLEFKETGHVMCMSLSKDGNTGLSECPR